MSAWRRIEGTEIPSGSGGRLCRGNAKSTA
jgi:hypothetical protein